MRKPIPETPLEQWLTSWVSGQPGKGWPRPPHLHTRRGDLSWHLGACWWYSGGGWYLRLQAPGYGAGWALGLLAKCPAEHMPLVTRNLGDQWVVQLLVDGRAVRSVHAHPGLAVGQALWDAYRPGE